MRSRQTMRAVRSGGTPVNELDLRQCRAALDHDAFSGDFSLRRLSPDDDLDLVHSWMNDPEVARFWRMPWPLGPDRGLPAATGPQRALHARIWANSMASR